MVRYLARMDRTVGVDIYLLPGPGRWRYPLGRRVRGAAQAAGSRRP